MWTHEDIESDTPASRIEPTGAVAVAAPASFGPTPTPAGTGTLVPAGPGTPAIPTSRLATSSLAGGAVDIPPTLTERVELCKFLADADLLPTPLRRKPANVLLIMLKAAALDIPMSVALEHLHVIDGKVGHSAEMLRGLLARAGHVIAWPVSNDKEVVGELTLRHDPKRPRTVRFTIADAARMGLTKKTNWTQDPESMMVARVTTRLVGRHCPEVSLALGNLSALDADDEPTLLPDASAGGETTVSPPGEATVDAVGRRAAELLELAGRITDTEELKSVGQQAKAEKLLDVVVGSVVGTDGATVEPVTLQQALLRRMQEISDARAAQAGPQRTEKPAGKREAGA